MHPIGGLLRLAHRHRGDILGLAGVTGDFVDGGVHFLGRGGDHVDIDRSLFHGGGD